MLTRGATKGGGRQRERHPGSARLHIQCPTIHFLTVEPLDRRLGPRGRGHPAKPNRPRAPDVTIHPDDSTGLSESLAHPLAGRREADPEKARRVRLLNRLLHATTHGRMRAISIWNGGLSLPPSAGRPEGPS